jgi:hypothetical protein
MIPVFAAVYTCHLVLITVAQTANFDFTAAAGTNISNPGFVTYTVVLGSCVTFNPGVQNSILIVSIFLFLVFDCVSIVLSEVYRLF